MVGTSAGPASGAREGGDGEPKIAALPMLVGFLRRYLWLVAAATLACLAFGAAYAFTAPPLYTAQANLVIDPARSRYAEVGAPWGGAPEDIAAIETQMQILRSQRVALEVVRRLDLTEDPRFAPAGRDVVTRAVGDAKDAVKALFERLLGTAAPPAAPAPGGEGDALADASPEAARAARRVRMNAGVSRAGASHVVAVRYTAPDPGLAADVANALTRAFIDDRYASRIEATRRAADWMQGRIDELQEEATDAARAAQDFRARNDMVEIGEGGRLVSEEQLSRIGDRLVDARDAQAGAAARLAGVEAALESDSFDALAGVAPENGLLTDLRRDHVEARERLAEAVARYGAEHPTAVEARERMARLEESMRAELRRVATALEQEAETAGRRVNALETMFEARLEQAKETGANRVELDRLEAVADSYRATYESYLDRYARLVQERSAPVLETQVITPAAEPEAPSAPRKGLILALSTILGGGLGVAGAVLLASFDRSVRTPRQLAEMGLPCLAVAPAIGGGLRRRLARLRGRRSAGELTWATRRPLSDFATALRRARTAMVRAGPRAERRGTVIGVVSAGPGEGKSTLAANLAQVFAGGGARVALVDADLHAATLSKSLSGPTAPRLGRVEFLAAEGVAARLRSGEDAGPGAPRPGPEASPSDLMGSEAMEGLIGKLRDSHDVALLDLPPVSGVPDANALAHAVDGLLVVVRWGVARADAVEAAARALEAHGGVLLGALLNRADMRALRVQGDASAGEGYVYARHPPVAPVEHAPARRPAE